VTGGAYPQVTRGAHPQVTGGRTRRCQRPVPAVAGSPYPQLEPEWVDEVLLAGAADDACLHLARPVSRAELRRLVAERHRALADAGLQRGGSVALCLPPSLAFITNLLASGRSARRRPCWITGSPPTRWTSRCSGLLPQIVGDAERPTRPAAGLRRGHRARAPLSAAALLPPPTPSPAQLRLDRPVEDHRPGCRQPRRRSAALHADRRRPARRRAHRLRSHRWARAAGSSAACSTACMRREPARSRPSDGRWHPVRRRRPLAATTLLAFPSTSSCSRRCATPEAAAAHRHDHRGELVRAERP